MNNSKHKKLEGDLLSELSDWTNNFLNKQLFASTHHTYSTVPECFCYSHLLLPKYSFMVPAHHSRIWLYLLHGWAMSVIFYSTASVNGETFSCTVTSCNISAISYSTFILKPEASISTRCPQQVRKRSDVTTFFFSSLCAIECVFWLFSGKKLMTQLVRLIKWLFLGINIHLMPISKFKL